MKVYIAGGMRSDLGTQVANLLRASGHTVLDPRDWEADYPRPEDYTRRDLEAIRDSDAVLAFMSGDNPSGFGMSLEVGYAHGIGRPVYFLDRIRGDWRSRYFDMVRMVSGYHSDSIGGLIRAMEKTPDGALDSLVEAVSR